MGRRDGIVTRAVLYDMPQLKGVDWIEPGTPITRADLEAWEKKSGVKAGPGDVVLLYIGRWKRREKMGPWAGQVAGYYADTIPLMQERDLAFVGHDFNIDWNPRPGGARSRAFPELRFIRRCSSGWARGSSRTSISNRRPRPRGDCKRYEFMMTFAPIPVEGGTGSPVNPVAIF